MTTLEATKKHISFFFLGENNILGGGGGGAHIYLPGRSTGNNFCLSLPCAVEPLKYR